MGNLEAIARKNILEFDDSPWLWVKIAGVNAAGWTLLIGASFIPWKNANLIALRVGLASLSLPAFSYSLIKTRQNQKLSSAIAYRESGRDEVVATLTAQQIVAYQQQPIEMPGVSPVAMLPMGNDLPSQLGMQVIQCLAEFGVNLDWQGAIAAPSFYRLKLKPQSGVKVASIKGYVDNLQIALGLESPPMMQITGGAIAFDIPRQDRQFPLFRDYIKPDSRKPSEDVSVPIGVNIDGQLIEVSLRDAVHFLGGGTTGAGKSEFEKQMVASLCLRYPVESFRLYLSDVKQVTFMQFKDIPWLLSAIATDAESTLNILRSLIAEMEARYSLLVQFECENLSQFNQENPDKALPWIVCFIDEIFDLMSDKEFAPEIEESLKRLTAKARASGISLALFTQRPDAKVVTPLIRSNCPSRILLKTAQPKDDSKIISGYDGFESPLLGKGDLLFFDNARHGDRLQSLYLPPDELKAYIKEWRSLPIETPVEDINYESIQRLNKTHSKPPQVTIEVTSSEVTEVTSPPENDSKTDAEKFLELRNLRESGMTKTAIIKDFWELTGRNFEEGLAEFERLVCNFAYSWVADLRNNTDLSDKEIFELVYSPNKRNKTKLKEFEDQFQSILIRLGQSERPK